jgi:hypothetical protein
MKHERTRAIKETYRTCDLCDSGDMTERACSICHRDLCKSCRVFDDRDDGDYPDLYCSQCWKIGETYRERIEELQRDCDDDVHDQEQAWFDEAIEAAKRNDK